MHTDNRIRFLQTMEQSICVGDVTSCINHGISLSFYCPSYGIWCTFPMSVCHKVPHGVEKSQFVCLCSQQVKVLFVSVLGCRPIRKEVHICNVRLSLPQAEQDWLQMCPYSRWVMTQWIWKGGKWLMTVTPVHNSSVYDNLAVACSEVCWLYFWCTFTLIVFWKVYMYDCFIAL